MFGFGSIKTDDASHFLNPPNAQTISNLMYIPFSPNPAGTSPVEASTCVQSLPNLAAGKALLCLLLELLGHRDITEPLTAL